TPGSKQANTPLDSEHGPGYHLAVLPFTDGGAGVSLVISHCLTDGIGLCEALADAAFGRDDPISWSPAASRRRWPALREGTRQTARDIPTIGRAMVTAARLARGSRRWCRSRHPAAYHATCADRRRRRTHHGQRRRSLSMPTSGRPARTHSAGLA